MNVRNKINREHCTTESGIVCGNKVKANGIGIGIGTNQSVGLSWGIWKYIQLNKLHTSCKNNKRKEVEHVSLC